MADPEIARRCHACGVSIREEASFCPQCGKELEAKLRDADTEIAPNSQDVSKAETISEARSDASEIPAAAPTPAFTGTDAARNSRGKTTDRTSPQRPRSPQDAPKARDPRTRPTAVARDLEDNVLQRVQRLRKVSSVVIDQAAYDPSLRFVLVAAALFVLFLVIVIVSKLIG